MYANSEGQSKQQVGQSLTPQVAKNAQQSSKELKLVEENLFEKKMHLFCLNCEL